MTAPTKGEEMTRWEYLTEMVNMTNLGPEVHLNVFGEDGWELVAVGAANSEGERLCVFKRPLSEDDE